MKKEKILQNLHLKLRKTAANFFIKQLTWLSTVFVIGFSRTNYIETLQTMGILLLKALREEDFGHKLQQIPLFFSSNLDKFKLETQLKTLIHIVDEKQD